MRGMNLFVKVMLVALALYAVLLGVAYLGQRRLMYFPDPQRILPQTIGLQGVTELEVPAPDGHSVIAWHAPARDGKPTLLYFHGNAGNLADRQPRIARFMAQGWGVMMMSYRGYGGSTGRPTEIDNVADGLRTYEVLRAKGVATDQIILYGESLGSGVAVQVAADRPSGGLILDAPFTSVVEVASLNYWFFPVRQLLRDRYESRAHIRRVKAPVLILHGEHDRVIPVAMGRNLFALANEPKRLVIFPDGGHSNLYLDGNDALSHLVSWVAELDRRR